MGDNSGCNETNEIVVNVNKDVSNITQDSTAHATASLLQKVSSFLYYYSLQNTIK